MAGTLCRPSPRGSAYTQGDCATGVVFFIRFESGRFRPRADSNRPAASDGNGRAPAAWADATAARANASRGSSSPRRVASGGAQSGWGKLVGLASARSRAVSRARAESLPLPAATADFAQGDSFAAGAAAGGSAAGGSAAGSWATCSRKINLTSGAAVWAGGLPAADGLAGADSLVSPPPNPTAFGGTAFGGTAFGGTAFGGTAPGGENGLAGSAAGPIRPAHSRPNCSTTRCDRQPIERAPTSTESRLLCSGNERHRAHPLGFRLDRPSRPALLLGSPWPESQWPNSPWPDSPCLVWPHWFLPPSI